MFDPDPSCDTSQCTGEPDPKNSLTLAELFVMLKDAKCRWDDTPLCNNGQVVIDAYEHDNGWSVDNYVHKLWLSVKCPKCHYEWSIWKLGVAR
jgi:hypothetical protein